ncbi:MAG: GNAT family N-acetyltransferase, partial [Bacteroidota bacterium]
MSVTYELRAVTDFKHFHAVLDAVYRGNKQYIYPLRSDIEGILTEKNAAYDGDNLRRWVVLENGKKAVGRIAAFIDKSRNEELELPVGGIGFFESIEDDKVAELLFDAAENWLRERGMHAVDGPVNFGERDKFWGLLIKGWYRPIYQETYNPPYYQRLFEDRGYQAHEQCLTMRGVVSEFPRRSPGNS